MKTKTRNIAIAATGTFVGLLALGSAINVATTGTLIPLEGAIEAPEVVEVELVNAETPEADTAEEAAADEAAAEEAAAEEAAAQVRAEAAEAEAARIAEWKAANDAEPKIVVQAPVVETPVVEVETPNVPAPVETLPAAPAMPDVIGMNLQDAQDLIQANGVFFSRSDDASGANRFQMLDRNWFVVAQNVAPGAEIGEFEVVLSVLKYTDDINL